MTEGYRHIACCFDGSDGSRRALEEAVRVRDMCGARLTVVHAFEVSPARAGLGEGAAWMPTLDQSLEVTERWLEDEAAAATDAASVLLGPGFAPWAICRWAEDAGVELLVAGSNRTFVERVLLGSFASYLSRHAPCPVLLVRPRASSPAEREVRAEVTRAAS